MQLFHYSVIPPNLSLEVDLKNKSEVFSFCTNK